MAFSSQFAGAPWLNAPKKANGLLGLLGVSSNPFTDFLGNNSNTLIGLGAGIAGGGPDLGQAVGQGLTLAGQGKQADYTLAEKAKADALLKSQTNQTVSAFQKANRPDLVARAQSGDMKGAWDAYMKDPTGTGADPFTLSAGQTRYGADGKPLASMPADPNSAQANAPASLQEYNFYADQATKAGQKPMSYLDFKQASGNNQGTTDDATAIAGEIIAGRQPPDTKGLYRLSGPIRAQLAAQGFDYNKANEDWNATQKLLGSLNGAQQVRLRQAVQQTTDSLGLVDQLAQQWHGSGYPVFNKATLTLAAQGAPGFTPEQQSLATQLVAEINDVTSDLGTVYKGGNSSTDESLKLAASQLSADWSEQTLRNAIALAKQNLVYRQNSLKLTPGGIDNSQYGPSGPDALAPANVGPAGVTAPPQTASPVGPGPVQSTGDPELDRALQQYGQ